MKKFIGLVKKPSVSVCVLTCLLIGGPFSPSSARAAVLLDTIHGPYIPNSGYTVSNIGGVGQSIALLFSAGEASMITTVEAYIYPIEGDGLVNVGIVADNGGPTGAFLNFASVTLDSLNPVNISSLEWEVTPGKSYWVVAKAVNGTVAAWSYKDNSLTAKFAYTDYRYNPSDGPWFVDSQSFLPEVRIVGDVEDGGEVAPAVPELSTWAMILLGFLGLGFVGNRKQLAARPN
jgi:hypothetical protein